MASQFSRQRILFLLLAIFSTTFSSAYAQVTLKAKAPTKASWKQTVHSSISQTMSIAGMELPTKNDSKSVIGWKITKKNDDGSVEVVEQPEKMSVKLQVPGGLSIEYDSDKEVKKTGSPLDSIIDLYSAIKTAQTTVVFDKDGLATSASVSGLELEELPPAIKAAVEQQLASKRIVIEVNMFTNLLPSAAVEKGESWSRVLPIPLDAGQSLEVTSDYTYDGIVTVGDKKLHKISAAIKSVVLKVDANPASPLKIAKSDLKSTESSKSEIYFDDSIGNITKTDMVIDVEGEIVLSTNGQEIPAELALKISSKTSID